MMVVHLTHTIIDISFTALWGLLKMVQLVTSHSVYICTIVFIPTLGYQTKDCNIRTQSSDESKNIFVKFVNDKTVRKGDLTKQAEEKVRTLAVVCLKNRRASER